MGQYYVFFNPFSSNGNGKSEADKVHEYLKNESLLFIDMTAVKDSDYTPLFEKMYPGDKIVLCGGDGTLNRFVNDCDDQFPKDVDIFLFPTGTGNDFLRDINVKTPCGPVLITQYLKDLPVAEVNGKKQYFLNNVAFGIDGWVVEEILRIKETNPQAKEEYTKVAISGLLGKYHPVNAKVTVDGQSYSFQKVWMAPAMKGRFMGGGMMVAPQQDRLDPEQKVSLVLFQNGRRLQIALAFPGVFSGKHIKNKCVVVLQGHDITVEYDAPRAVQIDGEAILGVTKYHAYTQK